MRDGPLDRRKKGLMGLVLRRLFRQFVFLGDLLRKGGAIGVHVQETLRRIVRFVGAGKPHVEEERIVPAVVGDPCGGHLAGIHVGMENLLVGPGTAVEAILPGGVGLEDVKLPFPAVHAHPPSPVVFTALLQGVVFHFVAHVTLFVKPDVVEVRLDVRLAHVGAVVSPVAQGLDPSGVVAPVVEGVHPRVVGVHAGKDRGAAGNAGGAATEGVGVRRATSDQAVQVRRDHVPIPQRVDRVQTLLVGGDEDDVGLLCHERVPFCRDQNLVEKRPQLALTRGLNRWEASCDGRGAPSSGPGTSCGRKINKVVNTQS